MTEDELEEEDTTQEKQETKDDKKPQNVVLEIQDAICGMVAELMKRKDTDNG